MNGLQAEYGDRIAFQKLNVNEPDGRLALQRYRVPGHPTVIILDATGKQLWSRTGASERRVYIAAIEDALNR